MMQFEGGAPECRHRYQKLGMALLEEAQYFAQSLVGNGPTVLEAVDTVI
jgi:hypothetical protein